LGELRRAWSVESGPGSLWPRASAALHVSWRAPPTARLGVLASWRSPWRKATRGTSGDGIPTGPSRCARKSPWNHTCCAAQGPLVENPAMLALRFAPEKKTSQANLGLTVAGFQPARLAPLERPLGILLVARPKGRSSRIPLRSPSDSPLRSRLLKRISGSPSWDSMAALSAPLEKHHGTYELRASKLALVENPAPLDLRFAPEKQASQANLGLTVAGFASGDGPWGGVAAGGAGPPWAPPRPRATAQGPTRRACRARWPCARGAGWGSRRGRSCGAPAGSGPR